MATITRKQNRVRQFGSAPYGNLSVMAYHILTDSTGAVSYSDSTAAVASGDKIRIGQLPEGMTLDEAIITISTAWTASVTGKLGFEYVDGIDDAAVPQDDDYFMVSGSLATAAIVRRNNPVQPVTLPKPAYLILTTGGANNAKASRIDIKVIGELTGPR